MVKSPATWSVIATLSLVSTTAQFVGEYEATRTKSLLDMRAIVKDGFVSWKIESPSGSKVSSPSPSPLREVPGHYTNPVYRNYTVDYEDFDQFKNSVNTAFSAVKMQDGDLTYLRKYSALAFTAAFDGESLLFLRKALPPVTGKYAYLEGGKKSFALVVIISSTSITLKIRCGPNTDAKEFTNVKVDQRTNIQYLPDKDAYARFIHKVVGTCSRPDLPTSASPTLFVFSPVPNTLYVQLDADQSGTFTLKKVE
ncbi:hypothetical protein FOZ60_000494 [Perkinsus olseni]|uniref:Uncharacterized protein n=1 Tax=Perkinsus olseni TaxID=32597 RepID=A0A7J6P4H1_PEROL|nr:hypothetical protein FOZ60_000494 [Perkinsus olseni]